MLVETLVYKFDALTQAGDALCGVRRGQQLAALGDCAVCHTSVNGILSAGGRPLPTPFGTIYSTNITPDVETGIGAWSYPAFERAMRRWLA